MRGDIEGQPRSDAEAYGVLPGADESGIRQGRSPKRSVGTLVLGGIAAAGLVAVIVFLTGQRHVSPSEITERAPEVAASWLPVARVADDLPHDVFFVIRERDGKFVEDLVLDRANPASPNFRRWFSKAEVTQMVRDEVSHKVVHDFLLAWGGVTLLQSTDIFIRARAEARVWARMFGSELHQFQHEDGAVRTRADSLTLPSALVGRVVGVLNWLDIGVAPPRRVRHELDSSRDAGVSSRFPGYVTPALLHEYYGVPETTAGSADVQFQEKTTQMAYASLGQTWSPQDLQQFQQVMGVPQQPVTELDHNGQHSSSCTGSNAQCGEANLDVQQLSGMSPWSNTSFYYMPGSTTFEDFLEQVQQMNPPPEVISISYGGLEYYTSASLVSAFDSVAKSLSLQGTTILASSGDDGANGVGASVESQGYTCEQVVQQVGLTVSWPVSSPWVTGVGATMGTESDSPEIACAVNAQGPVANASVYPAAITSGGGYSQKISKPSWQVGVSGSYRGVPDLSAAGHAFVVDIGGRLTPWDGTSASCPVVAGMISLINAALKKAGTSFGSESSGECEANTGGTCFFFPCHASRGQTSCTHHRCLCEPGFCAVGGKCVPQSAPTPAPAPSGRSVGFINPILYSNPGAFNDITQGDNNCTSSGKMCCAGYSAGPGWDAVTGMGSPKFEALKAALVR